MKKLMKMAGMVVMIGFISPMVTMAAVYRGGLIQFYEPSLVICIVEILLGLFACVVGGMIIEEEMMKK